MLAGLSTSLKTSAIKNSARRSSLPSIRRPKSPPPPPPQAHFITHNLQPTDLVSTKQLKDGGKQEESISSYERIGMAELAATRTTVLDVPVSQEEKDAYVAARRFFGAKEFDRVTFTLKEFKSAQSRFLSCYSQFLVRCKHK